MTKSLILTKKAQQDLDDSYYWYEQQSQGLGKELIRCVDAELAKVARNPLLYQVIWGETVHRALTDRFPYSIFYVNEENLITVFAILHQRRDPREWQSRAERR